MITVGTKIVATTMEDARFLEGDDVIAAMGRVEQFGKVLEIYFDDFTYVRIEPLKDKWGEALMGTHQGHWRNENDQIVKIAL